MGKNKKNDEADEPASPSQNDADIYSLAVQKWGQDAQLDILVEELVEAIEAVIDFKDPGTVERAINTAAKGLKKKRSEYGGVAGFFDAMGLTVAQYVKIQVVQLKTTVKMFRKKGLSIYNEQLGIGTLMESAARNLNEAADDGAETDPREHLAEELADVELMIEQARHGMGLSDLIDKYKRFKIERLRKRLEGEDPEP